MARASSGTLVFTPASLNFGAVGVGASKTLTVAILNTGTTTVTFARESLVANNFTVSGFTLPSSLAAGKTLTVSVVFTPRTEGIVGAYIRFDSNASNALVEYELTGTGVTNGAHLTSTPATANLGSVPTSVTNSQVIQLRNTGSTTLSISGAKLGGSSEFKPCKLSYPLELAAGKTANCTIHFTPSSTGSVSGSLVFSSNATDKTLSVPLSGQGIAATRTLTATPTSVNFEKAIEGKSETIAVVLKNTGNSNVLVSRITTSTVALNASGGVEGATLTPGQSATLHISYSPAQVGKFNGRVNVTSNATGSPIYIGVTGDVISGGTHEVALSWRASASTGVAGYNVYRATLPSENYVKLTSSILTSTSFPDTNVTAGDTYSYEVTAVNDRGEESVPSAEVSVVIP